MREGKFLTINKKPTNFFLEKSKDVPDSVFKKAPNNYQKTLSERQGEANGYLNERSLELSPEREKVVSEVVIHGRDGKIRDKDSYGPDPNPPKDLKN